MVNLYHRKNEIAIDLADVQNVESIDLYYSGKIYGESQLPDDWQLLSNNNRIDKNVNIFNFLLFFILNPLLMQFIINVFNCRTPTSSAI